MQLKNPNNIKLLSKPAISVQKAQRAACLTVCAKKLTGKGTDTLPPLSDDSFDMNSRKIAIFVEPSPFSHVSGMKNRFECLIKGLRDAGDDVVVFTPDKQPPEEFHGAKVVNVLGFPLPFYNSPTLLLSIGLSVRVMWHLLMRRPDVIHVSTPGVLVFAAILYAKLLSIPLVVSYHTHVPEYIPKYTWSGFVQPMWAVIRFCTCMADLTLVTSNIMKEELSRNRCRRDRIEVWQRGVDTEVFSPQYRSEAMRERMTNGVKDKTLLVYVGRLGAEKNLFLLREILDRVPNACLSFVGDGPERQALEEHFAGYPVTFMGMMKGQDLSQAYASGDIFMMPSETETLGFVALEAMASGLPVVAVRAGGLVDIITQPGTTGFFYEPGDVEIAAKITQQLVDDVELRKKVGEAARADVQAWGWNAATDRLRTQQYARAIRNRVAKKRFWGLALRVWFTNRLYNMWSGVAALAYSLVNFFDYARLHRQEALPEAKGDDTAPAVLHAGTAGNS